ncbi:MAG TPA: glycoside hydrolase family 2 TIM barrel-domain containing protein [Candidatus Acidoferrum sp.]|nr:glycoside hydrolase family 2 TIM barrel-domain containing protein [Candidatus Acidoferrum sp.]
MSTESVRCIGLFWFVLLSLSGPAGAAGVTREQNFDARWRFLRADTPGAEQPDFNDSAWRVLDVPHDWSIEDLPPNGSTNRIGPFDPDLSAGADATGNTVGGTGWYRKAFTLPKGDAGRRIAIRFDGVYLDADVWLNGELLGNHPYGYTPFSFDLTPHLKPGGETNVLSVRVRNEGQNSRWYSGSGIYRHVVLTVTDPLRVAEYGLQVTTPQVSPQAAMVQVRTEIVNDRSAPATATVRIRLIDAKGKTLAGGSRPIEIPAGDHGVSVQTLTVTSPRLWSPATPNLYQAEAELLVGGKVVDATTTTFGIRKVEVDAEHGFRLNGEPLKLKGGCLHHDNGPLGAAAIDRAEERRVELMKAFGFNAIRTSHNPPSPAFLDACDRLGLLVLDEAFDCWVYGKKPDDYHRFFEAWSDRDITAMVQRDRNHPSVIMWSIGNEIPERFDRPDLARRLRATVLTQDPTRPITAAINPMWEPQNRLRNWETDSDTAFLYLDVGGYNYQPQKFASDHARQPQRVMMTTESFPKDAFEYWAAVKEHVYVIGDFVWTGMDYLGESGIGHSGLDHPKYEWNQPWPWFNAYCGDIDLCGFKKPQSYYRDVVWSRVPLALAVHAPIPEGRWETISGWGWPDEHQSWTWPGQEGRPLNVAVYSRCDTVRLELNGKLIGEQPVSAATKLTAYFAVPYSPGELRAIGYLGGREIARVSLRTVGAPAGLRLTPDRSTIHNDRNDLSFVTVEVVDQDGNLVPNAAIPVRFEISGAGELAAVGSGNPRLPESFQQPKRTTFEGRCLAIVRPLGRSGKVTLQAEADGLASATTTLQVR